MCSHVCLNGNKELKRLLQEFHLSPTPSALVWFRKTSYLSDTFGHFTTIYEVDMVIKTV